MMFQVVKMTEMDDEAEMVVVIKPPLPSHARFYVLMSYLSWA
jgi:hypothetical protein